MAANSKNCAFPQNFQALEIRKNFDILRQILSKRYFIINITNNELRWWNTFMQ